MVADEKCYDHPSQYAVSQCRACGAYLCRDCAEAYGVLTGEYAGQSLCYHCTTLLVASNIKEVAKLRKTVKREHTGVLVGASIGALIGLAMGGPIGLLIGFGAGGSLRHTLTVAGRFIKILVNPHDENAVTPLSGLALTILLSPIGTTRKIVSRIIQLRQATAILANDQQALEAMRAYYEYTQFIEKYKGGVDFVKHAREELKDNSYAKAIVDKGEESAQRELRKSVIQIATNGEIIRSFEDTARKVA